MIALYPSIDQDVGPKIVAEEVEKLELDYINVDMPLLGVYLDISMTKEELKRE